MRSALCVFCGLSWLIFPFALGAQDAEAKKITQPPTIDGRLSEPLWQTAKAITEFKQRDPAEGQPATEPTRVRIVYDEARIYIGVEVIDSDPGQIRATELRRDNTLENDDSFAVILDTFHDHRNAFLFRINPRGTRYDGLIRNESRFVSSEWDEQWTAAATLTEEGWSAEIAIPFKILRFPSAKDQVWGLNFERVIKRKNEFVYWAGWDRNYAFTNVSQAGHLHGISEIRQAERLRIRPYVISGIERFAAISNPKRRTVREVGIDDLKFSVTSNLTADLAANPDFAQTEVDAQQVNLTQFSLFFPEKRQFFIEGADSLKMGVGLLHFGAPPLELFYSRSVGLSPSGEPIPLAAGGKLTGKLAGFDLGVFNAQTERHNGVAGENFAVGRIRKELLGRSYIGAILTNREGGGRFNRVAAADARFVFKKYLNAGAVVAKSARTNGAGKQWARQAGIEWRDDRFEIGMNYIKVDPQFTPGLGFVRRKDRLLGERIDWKPRPGGKLIRQFEISPSHLQYNADGGMLLTRLRRMNFATIFQSGDRVDLDAARWSDRNTSFSGPVRLTPGLYQWDEFFVTLRSYNGRKLSGIAGYGVGGYYSGHKSTLNIVGDARPNKNLSFGPTYSYNNVDLREGSFDTHLIGLRSNISFTNNLLTSAYLQYNSSGNLGAFQVRFNYIFRTIDNFFIVYNETRYTDGIYTGKSNRSLVLKMTYSVHR